MDFLLSALSRGSASGRQSKNLHYTPSLEGGTDRQNSTFALLVSRKSLPSHKAETIPGALSSMSAGQERERLVHGAPPQAAGHGSGPAVAHRASTPGLPSETSHASLSSQLSALPPKMGRTHTPAAPAQTESLAAAREAEPSVIVNPSDGQADPLQPSRARGGEAIAEKMPAMPDPATAKAGVLTGGQVHPAASVPEDARILHSEPSLIQKAGFPQPALRQAASREGGDTTTPPDSLLAQAGKGVAGRRVAGREAPAITLDRLVQVHAPRGTTAPLARKGDAEELMQTVALQQPQLAGAGKAGGQPVQATAQGNAASFQSVATAPQQAALPASFTAQVQEASLTVVADRVLSEGQQASSIQASGTSANPSAPQASQSSGLPLQISVSINKLIASGGSRIQIELKPQELGRLEISLDARDSVNIKARILVERPETLDMLRTEVRVLERILQEAGIDVGRRGIDLGLSGQNANQNGKDSGAPGERGQGARDAQQTAPAADDPSQDSDGISIYV